MPQDPDSARTSLRARVAAADRQRRTGTIARLIWRSAPLAAGVSLLVAIAGRLANWPALVGITALFISLGTLAAVAAAARRARDVSDRDAAVIDSQAGLEGELRSAHWFAQDQQDDRGAPRPRDAWIDFHVARAAARIEAIDWNRIYPAPRTPRAKAATGILAVTALLVAVGLPGRASMASLTGRPGGDHGAARGAAVLPVTAAELLARLQDILTAAEHGKGRAISAEEVRGLLAQVDKLLGQPADKQAAAKDAASKSSKPISEADLKALAERAKRASESADVEPEVRDALADMSNKLSEQATAQNAATKDPRDAATAEENASSESAQAQAGGGKQDPSAQSVKEAAGNGGIGVIMMAGDAASSKEAGLGLGGAAGSKANDGQMPNLSAALRKETIESAKDDEGDKNVQGERRQTEQSAATAAYAHTAPVAAGRGRSTAPPAVPEARKAALRSYFIRKQ